VPVAFPFNVYLVAVASACLITLAAVPFWRRWCLRRGLVDEPGHRKIHAQPIPLAGGLAVATGVLLPMLVAAAFLASPELRERHVVGQISSPSRHTTLLVAAMDPASAELLHYGMVRRSWELAGILLGALGMLALGLLDDQRELSPGRKLIGQILVAAVVAASGARITLFVPNLLFSYGITILWILTVINAFNFMDNMNGLCAGLGAIGSWYFGILAAAQGQYLVALIALVAFGALLGFLPFNFPRARVFLGDSGSHLVGYLLAVLAILPHFYTRLYPHRWAVLVPLMVLAVPLLDLAWVVVLRWRLGQPFYVGDTNHLSHRLVRRGFSTTRAVLLIWLMAALIGALAALV